MPSPNADPVLLWPTTLVLTVPLRTAPVAGSR
jgi:hypothetical protein